MDYERRLREAENQRERLLDEMEARETTLIAKVSTHYHGNTDFALNSGVQYLQLALKYCFLFYGCKTVKS